MSTVLQGCCAPNWSLILGGGWILCTAFDITWFLRLAYTRLSAFFLPRVPMDGAAVVPSLCTTTDIDFFCHMNNARYLRECDFGRFDFYFRSGLADYIRSQPDVYVVQHACMLRYRRSLDFLMPFKLQTRLLYFDERSLYFEQRFISWHDDFVRAIALCKNTAVNCDVIGMMKKQFGIDKPTHCPPALKTFIEANDASSAQMKSEAENKKKRD